MLKAIEVFSELYTNSVFESYVLSVRDNVFSHLTDTVTLFAALAAIALPLAQQTFQWASDKYRSEHLIDFIESSSPIHPKKLNRKLILYVAVVFTFKLISPLLNDFLFCLALLFIVSFFVINIIHLIKYLSHTYEMGKGIKGIRAKILSKNLNLEQSMYTEVEIAILADYESYMLENESLYDRFSSEFFELRCVIINRIESIDEKVVAAYVQGMRKALYCVPSSSNDKKYLYISHSYLFFIQSIICNHSKYFYLLDELVESAAVNEPFRKGDNKPLLKGLIFQNIIYHREWPVGLAQALVSHFKRLTQTCIDIGEIGQLVHLYKEYNASLGLSVVTKNELQYQFHSYIDNYDSFIVADNLVTQLINTDDIDIGKEKFIVNMTPLINGLDKEKQDIFDDFFSELQTYEYQKKAEVSFESFLADIAKSDVKMVLAIRDARNSISSNVSMLGYDLLPTSKEGVVTKISRIGSNVEEMIFRDDKHNQHLMKAYVTLLIYEVCKTVRSDVDNNYQFLNQLSFRELDKLRLKISEVNQIQEYLINLPCFVDLFFLHAMDSAKVNKKFAYYTKGLIGAVDERLQELSINGTLDQEVIDRFLDSLPNNNEIYEKHSHLFSNKVKLSCFAKYRYATNFARSNFLADTGTYHDFNGIGLDIVESHFEKIYQHIFTASEGFEFKKAWPVNYSRLILLNVEQKIELQRYGFKFVKNKIYWPNGTYCTFRLIRDNSNKIVTILPDETLIQVSCFNAPIYEVTLIDGGENIKWEFTLNVMPCGYKY
jgi:hypothetical protein